jgi:branched-chain amino acid transport system permease protein
VTEFFQLLAAGTALGARYALVALGFVIIFRATGVINFAQGGLLLAGAYLAYAFGTILPFVVAVLAAMLAGAALGAVIERVAVRPLVGQPVFAVIMVTIGLLFVLEQAVTTIWGFDNRNLGDPWGVDTFALGDVTIATRDAWTVAMAAGVLVAFFAVFRFSKLGVAMRATAFDPEAALAQGISARTVYMASWGMAAALATLAGISLASGPAQLAPTIGAIALVAFPAMIVGGMDSPGGAVLGGIIIGITQAMTAGYQDELFPWAGNGLPQVMPYVVMVLILLVRPYGLFGTPEVRRL